MHILYLASEYPAFSHTFILHEVLALRANGIQVSTASVRHPTGIDTMTPADRAEHDNTLYLRNNLLLRGLWALAAHLLRNPHAVLAMLRAAITHCALAGPKSPFKAVGYLLEAALLLRHMQHHRIHHVHVHFANAAANIALIAAATGLVSYSLSAHGPDIFYDVEANLLTVKARQAAFVRCISHYCASQFMRIMPWEQWDRLPIVRCGVSTSRFAPSAGNPAPPPAPQGTLATRETIRLLCLGRICPAKAQPLLLRALRLLRDEGHAILLTVAGGGEDLPALKQLAHSLNIADSVTFTGTVDHDTAHKLYDTADIFVLPSVAEGVPVVLMEAMSKEIPCVATCITGIPELITNGLNGLLATPGDVTSLAACIRSLLTDADLRQRLGRAARQKVLASYDITDNGKTMAQLFHKFLTEQGEPR